MKFVFASYGTRGDVEPCVVIGRELVRRGHQVRLAVPPDQVGFVESGGLPAVEYGLDVRAPVEAARDFFHALTHRFWNVTGLIRLYRNLFRPVRECWTEMNRTLLVVTDSADVVITGPSFPEVVANVAERNAISLVALHFYPQRPNGRLVPGLPAPLVRWMVELNDWLYWRLTKGIENAQRAELGLAPARTPAPGRLIARGTLEIQAYDPICFPGLATEWAQWESQRPFVGALTMEMATEVDDEVLSWIAAGSAPILFGFGSIPVKSPAEMMDMITSACAELGARALVVAGWSDMAGLRVPDDVKLVTSVSYAAVFPQCRAVVHHGGAGTIPIGLRAGVPTLALWLLPEQSFYGGQLKRLGAGYARRFAKTTPKTLVKDLTRVLESDCTQRARALGSQMSDAAVSCRRAADILEEYARRDSPQRRRSAD
ncbi:glycosyltransferase [Mycolicibacterium confluentis]|uniref:glycosyltransferase n=1 Tax=Mycolicibacterium confluentis TaxID=28047 RepID=UPI000A1686BA|nr:glycosyltransferase [Mycolicibacterium confluentis]ORV29841.1 glycosyl transferase family 1 [Mycolicibacterium confluentis]